VLPNCEGKSDSGNAMDHWIVCVWIVVFSWQKKSLCTENEMKAFFLSRWHVTRVRKSFIRWRMCMVRWSFLMKPVINWMEISVISNKVETRSAINSFHCAWIMWTKTRKVAVYMLQGRITYFTSCLISFSDVVLWKVC